MARPPRDCGLPDHQAGFTGDIAQTGAVTLIQRFGSALNLNIHFPMLFLDGVYHLTEGSPSFRRIKAPTAAALAQLVHTLSERLARHLERRGWLVRDDEQQKGHTAQSESACQTILIARLTLACAELATRSTNSSRQPSIECPPIESSNADDQMHFTPIRQENCDSKKAGPRPSMVCDSVPQGRLSRSEWRTGDPVAHRSGLCCSSNPRQTFMPVHLDDVASREAVKFNDKAQQRRGTGELGVAETIHAPPSAAASGSAAWPRPHK